MGADVARRSATNMIAVRVRDLNTLVMKEPHVVQGFLFSW